MDKRMPAHATSNATFAVERTDLSDQQKRLNFALILLALVIAMMWALWPTEPPAPIAGNEEGGSYFEDISSAISETEEITASDGTIGTSTTTTEPLRNEDLRPDWEAITVKSGDNLASIFHRLGLNSQELYDVMQLKDAKTLKALHPGDKIDFKIDGDNQKLEAIAYPINNRDTLSINWAENQFKSEITHLPMISKTSFATVNISSSLYVDAHNMGLTNKTIMQLSKIFAWDIDFKRAIHAGDQFQIIYQDYYIGIGDKKVGTGNILAAQFTHSDKTYYGFRYKDKSGELNYYDQNGKGLQAAFLSAPVKYSRISSRFNLHRMHPILHIPRPHSGVDFAAPYGTPIKATAAGKIIFRGRKGGYGNAIVIKHGGHYSTLYGHMSRFSKKYKSGSRVKQGDVIGYVGSSGLATGAHVHYEVRIDKRQVDPLKVKVKRNQHIAKNEQEFFKSKTQNLLSQLNGSFVTETKVSDSHAHLA